MSGYGLGIDVGTTYTAAAVTRAGRVETVTLGTEIMAIPSAVFLTSDGTFLVGDAAVRRGEADPTRLAREFKRRLGDPVPIIIGSTPISAQELTATLLRSVVQTVSDLEGGPPDAVAVTYPASWGPYKRELFVQAVHLAGLEDAVLVTEPEAAAVSYAAAERVQVGDAVAVYDLGGGTFDAAVLRRTPAGFELLGRPEGIERLGGIDFDEAVVRHVYRSVPAVAELDPEDPVNGPALLRLRLDCVRAKKRCRSTRTSSPSRPRPVARRVSRRTLARRDRKPASSSQDSCCTAEGEHRVRSDGAVLDGSLHVDLVLLERLTET